MENDVKQRIKLVLSHYKVSQNSLSHGNGAMQKRLSSQLNGTTALTYQTISCILEAFPEVSSEWLLRGTEPMLKSASSAPDMSIHNEGTNSGIMNTGTMVSVSTGHEPTIDELESELKNLQLKFQRFKCK